jgi:hypothetical protein
LTPVQLLCGCTEYFILFANASIALFAARLPANYDTAGAICGEPRAGFLRVILPFRADYLRPFDPNGNGAQAGKQQVKATRSHLGNAGKRYGKRNRYSSFPLSSNCPRRAGCIRRMDDTV